VSPDIERRTLNSVTLDTLAGASVEEANSLTGELIGGILEVGELLGKGGMGVVYQVFHREWNRQLAMKVPLALGEQDGFDLKRWVREAHTWIDLGLHPRVVSCWFVRQWKGVPILFLDLFSGGSLKERLEKRDGPPSTPQEWGEAITWLIHACEGLQHAHQMGLVHRDIKPANLMFDSEDTLAVTDFGLGKAIAKTSSDNFDDASLAAVVNSADFSKQETSLTRTGVMSGTPHYAPPEQWMQKQVGPEADIYALAILAYEVLTGRHPYEPPGERWTLGQLISAHLMGKPQPAHEFNPEVPENLSQALIYCLGKKPTDRPSFPNELREVLIHAFKERTGRDYAFGMPQPLSQRADALNNKAVSLWSIGLRDEAVQAWSEADRLERNHLEVTYNRMVTSWLTGRRTAEEAESAIRDLATASVRGRSSAGMFMLTRGHYDEAVSLLEESLESAMLTDDGTIWRGLGEAHMAVGHKEQAREAFEKALALIPTDQFSKNSIAQLDKSALLELKEGELWRTSWKARGRLTTWLLMENSMALVFLFGRKLVVVGRDGQEKVSLEVPITTNTPVLKAKNSHLFVVDGQKAWSMSVVISEGVWKLIGLRPWQQRVIGFVNADTVLVGDTTLQLRSRADGSQMGPLLVGHEKQVLSFEVEESTGKLLTGGADRVVRMWNLKDGQCEVEARGHQNFVCALTLGSQSQLAVSGDRSGVVILWHLPQMEKLHRFDFPGPIIELELKGVGREQTLFVIHLSEDEELRTAVVFLDRLQVVMDKSGRYFSWSPGFGICSDRGCRLFGLPEGVEWRSHRMTDTAVVDMLHRPDRDEVFLWTEESECILRKLPSKLPEPPSLPLVRANTLSEVQQARQQFANLMEAAWASYRSEDWSDSYWQLSRARLVEGYSREPETLELLSRLAKRLCRRELREMWRLRELTAPGGENSSRMTMDYRGSWAASSAGHVIRLWDLKNGTCIRGLTGHRDEVVALRFWEDGTRFGAAPLLLSFGADRTVRIWNPNSGECLQQLIAADHPIISAGVCTARRVFAFVTRGGELRVGRWGPEEPYEIEMMATCECDGIPSHVRVTNNARFVAVLEDELRYFEISESGDEVKPLGERPHYAGLSLGPHSGFIGAHPDGYLESLDLRRPTKGTPLSDPVKTVKSMTISDDSCVVATLDARDTLRFWLVDSDLCVLERPLTVRLKRVRFSGNGRYLAGLADNGSLLVWELEWQLDPNKPVMPPEEEAEIVNPGMWERLKQKFGF
jgi:serine/threonine protein kinase/WD40 repeat protein